MSLKVIELNDSAIKVGDENGIIVESPGFALAVGKELELGDAAERQARLQPTSSYNKFWHELSMEPLSHGNGVRHFADFAYAHLLHLAQLGEIDGDVIFAVPGNFTRQQLGILLGLAKQSPFNPVGVVDSALAAVIACAESPSIIYADIQLHQVLLTRLKLTGGRLQTESVIQVPGVGTQNFMELMMQLTTRLFIQQCRFNPQHNAESEQQLYNELPSWLRQNDEDQSSLLLELKTSSAVHTAKMPRESLINNLSGHYKKISQQIAALDTGKDNQLLLSARVAALPGFTASLRSHRNLRVLEPHTINRACLDFRDKICSDDDGMHLVNSLPVDSTRTQAADSGTQSSSIPAEQQDLPTHALFSNRAIAVDGIEIKNDAQLNGHAPSPNTIFLCLANLPEQLGRIEKRDEGVYLDSGKQEVLLNQTRVSGKQKLTLGDRIQFAEGGEEIFLIQVNDG